MNTIYEELKGWQSAISSLLGFLALMAAALWNFHLNRKRDAALRSEESLSIAAAIYGEIVLLRREAAALARLVSKIASNMDGWGAIKIDDHFLEANTLTEPSIYKSLAPKIGLLAADLVVPIAEFYGNYEETKLALPLLVEKTDRPYGYARSTLLKPARDSVRLIVPALRKIETAAGIKNGAEDPDLGQTDAIIAMEEFARGKSG